MKPILRSNHPFAIAFKAMMIFSVLIILLSFAPNNDMSKAGLKGKVKLLTHIDYQIIWDSIIQIRLSNKEELQFDRKGRGTTTKRYYTDKIFQDSSIAEYDDKGFLIEEKHYSRYKLDSFFLMRYMTYRYDSLGRKIELDQTAMPPNKSSKTVYIYDAKGKLTETKIYNADGSLKKEEVTKYDSKGYRMGGVNDNGDSTYFKNDTKGNILEKGSISREGYKHIFKYNNLGSLIEYETYKPDGSLDNKHILGFDKHHNEFDTTYTDKGAINITIRKLTYDKIGNWTIDSTFTNDTLTYIRTREFEYY